jgi:hypothetical protein
MRLVNKTLTLLVLASVAACGNYGNLSIDDAIYVNALPSKDQLTYTVPKDPAAPACVLGESKTASDTFTIGTNLEQLVLGILQIIDFIKAQPPSSRDAQSRTWGPWPDGQHPGIWDRVKMVRLSDAHFTFTVEQSQGIGGTYLTSLSADLLGAHATTGTGTLTFDYSASAQLGIGKPTDPTSGFVDIAYAAAGDPRTIDIKTRSVTPPVEFKVAAYADGEMQVFIDLTAADGTHIVGTSKFVKSGAGAASVRADRGLLGDTIDECWDALYCRGYLNDLAGWSPPCVGALCVLGSLANCPSLTGGLPF